MSTFGRIYRVSTFGVGCTVEGFPSNIKVLKQDIQKALTRRRPGQSSLTTKRNESDDVEILCGLENDISLGSPIACIVRNQDQRKQDYSEMSQVPRPGHADYTYYMKYGVKAESGGGRSSARETIGRVIAGALADVFLEKQVGMRVFSFVASVGDISVPQEVIDGICSSRDVESYSKEKIDELGQFKVFSRTLSEVDKAVRVFQNCKDEYMNELGDIIKLSEEEIATLTFVEMVNVRCPHAQTAVKIIQRITEAKQANDSIGGTIVCVVQNPRVGLGEPCFDKLPALLAHAMMSIPATKGFELGSGFSGTKMTGSTHNDMFYAEKNQNGSTTLRTHTNNAGGTLGGISSGENIYFRVAFKPVSTIGIAQSTCTMEGEQTILEAKGRHDPCVLPRAPPVVDAMTSMVMMDAYLLQNVQRNAQKETWSEI